MSEKVAVLLALFLAALPWTASAAQAEKVVTRIEFTGRYTGTEDRLKTRIVSREGRPFSREVLDQDVKRLYATGQFSYVDAAVAEAEEGGVRLSFHVEEKPRVKTVDVVGLRAIPVEEVRPALRLRTGGYLSDYLIKVDSEMLLARLREKAYPFAEVHPLVRGEGPEVDLYYQVTEGPHTGIRRIDFQGNQAISAKELRGVLTSWQLWFLGLWPSGNYSEKALAVDAERVQHFYRSRGYLDARVYVTRVDFTPDKSSSTVLIQIEEGVRYKVRAVKVSGAKLFPEDQVKAELKLGPGDVFLSDELAAGKAAIERKYGREAYIFAQVNWDLEYDPEPGWVTIALDLAEGERIHVERVIFRGNRNTRDDVLRRELTLYPGDPFNYEKWEDSFNRLAQRRFFKAIDLTFEEGSTPDRRDVAVRVEEDRTGTLLMGGGFASGIGVFGNFALTQRNFDITNVPHSMRDFFSRQTFVGGGQYIELRAQPGFDRSIYRLYFKEPYLGGRPITLATDLFYFQQDRLRYLEERRGGELSLGRRFHKDYVLELTTRAQDVGVTQVSTFASDSVIRSRGNYTLVSMQPSFSVEKEKLEPGSYYPYAGYTASISYRVTGGPLGGEVDMSRAEASGSYHWTVLEPAGWGRHVFSLRTDLGWQEPNRNTQSIPIYERFYMGGPKSIRGFQYRGVGPRETGSLGVSDPIGGNVTAAASAEYSVPLFGPAMRALAFFDAGDLEANLKDMDPDRVRMTYGLGLRIMVPLFQAPIAMDFGWPIQKQPEDEAQVFQFYLGFGF